MQHNNKVIIGYTSNLNSYEYFCKKMVQALSLLDDFEIYSIADEKKYIKKFFPEDIVKDFKKLSGAEEKKKLFSEATHAIYIWDGTELNETIFNSYLQGMNVNILPIETTKVVNVDKNQKYDIYIGRKTPWGNPYVIGDKGMTREVVIEKYKEYFENNFLSDPSKKKELLSLKGKILGCHCKPLPCHGDVIARYLNSLDFE